MVMDMSKTAGLDDQGFETQAIRGRQVDEVINIIRKNLDSFEEAGSVLAASFRRLERFEQLYSQEGCAYFVIIQKQTQEVIGGAGVSPLANLPPSEGLGEIHELVIQEGYRNQGLGAHLIEKCIDFAKGYGYQRLYLETTPRMEPAQRLFQKYGFQPITQKQQSQGSKGVTMPCYYLLKLG